MIKLFSKFIRCSRGVSALEFVLFLPLLLLLLVVSVEVSRYLIIIQKVEKTANTIAYIITQTTPNDPASPPQDWRMTRSEILNTANLFPELMEPYWENHAGIIFISSFTQDDIVTTPPVIDWIFVGGGGYRGNTISEVTGRSIHAARNTIEGTPIQLTADLQTAVDDTLDFFVDENVIAVEVFYEFRPLLLASLFDLGNRTIKRNAFAAPRYGNLNIISN